MMRKKERRGFFPLYYTLETHTRWLSHMQATLIIALHWETQLAEIVSRGDPTR